MVQVENKKKEHVTPGSSREAGEGELHFRQLIFMTISSSVPHRGKLRRRR